MLVLETFDLSEVLWQILGMAGFAETIFELVYVATEGSSFKSFERFFFTYTASWELLGEIVSLVGLCLMFVSDRTDRADEAEEAAEAGKSAEDNNVRGPPRWWDILRVLLRDPVHNLAHPIDLLRKEGEAPRSAEAMKVVVETDDNFSLYQWFAWVGVLLPAFSTVIWGAFLPIWGMFDGEDYDLRLWICYAFWIWAGVAFITYKCRDGESGIVFVAVTGYALNKGVELYLLFSRGDRLAEGFIGQGLRSLQVAELGSVAIIVYRALFTEIYDL